MKKLLNDWKALDVKTRIAYVTALIAFILGWGLTIAGFCAPPLGTVSDSVLWILGQALLYAASVFGVGMYTVSEVRSMKRNIDMYMRKPHHETIEDYDTDNNIPDASESDYNL